MSSEISKRLGHLLMSYAGPEPDRVRTAIAKLAKDDIQKIDQYLSSAQRDYRDVLRLADVQEEEDRKKAALRGMTVNERLFELKLFPEWDAAVAAKDRARASVILKKCELSDSDVERIIDAQFRERP